MNILALIPARGGSKRLPKKNIKLLGGKPLINWTIDVAKATGKFCDILVSTDDKEIGTVAQENGALVPWYRPSYLATDEANSVDVTLHALEWYQNNIRGVDGLLLLQPTSPFRTVELIEEGLKLFKDHAKAPVLGVSEVKYHPSWCMRLENNTLVPFLNKEGLKARSQDLPTVLGLNGSFYLVTPELLIKHQSFTPPGSIPLIVKSIKEAWDIDTAWDWEMAERMVL